MKPASFYKILFTAVLCVTAIILFAQEPVMMPGGVRRPTNKTNVPVTNNGTPNNPPVRTAADTSISNVERRDYSDDSMKVEIYYLSSVKPVTFDTSIGDYTKRFPIPPTHYYLGNNGSATHSFLFAPPATSGWDPGFHSFDVYKWKIENARFYNTQRPYTELGYMLASRQEQMIEILHTQNIKPYWNASFQYRLLAAPGLFRNQRNNHRNYQIASWYQSPTKRYNNYFIILNNRIQPGENGGIRSDKDYLNDPVYGRRFSIPTKLGGEPVYGADLFSTTLTTGRREKDITFLMRQQYDLGRKDSLVTDSTVIPLFYPRLRFEHTLRYTEHSFLFQDIYASGNVANRPDSTYYDSLYSIRLTPSVSSDDVYLLDKWGEWNNDFSIYQYPDANNLQQFIKLGAELQLLKGTFAKSTENLYNIVAHAQYRNRTKNQKWDINAWGRLHTAGYNSGDYHAYISLQRLLSQQLGTLQVGFENVNRSSSFIYDQRSSFYLDAPKNFGKENTIHIFGRYYIPKLKLQLNGDYYLVSNYLYLDDFKTLQQENAVFNFLRLSGLKTFRLSRRWNWHAELYVQQKTGNVELNVPLIYTRNRIAYEGHLFKNLNLSTGFEVRYNTPFKADNYSPVLGQFFYQDTLTIANRPDVHAFLHMGIRSFKLYVRLENLNTFTTDEGFDFNHNNMAAISYPVPGLLFRFGFYWAFIN